MPRIRARQREVLGASLRCMPALQHLFCYGPPLDATSLSALTALTALHVSNLYAPPEQEQQQQQEPHVWQQVIDLPARLELCNLYKPLPVGVGAEWVDGGAAAVWDR